MCGIYSDLAQKGFIIYSFTLASIFSLWLTYMFYLRNIRGFSVNQPITFYRQDLKFPRTLWWLLCDGAKIGGFKVLKMS